MSTNKVCGVCGGSFGPHGRFYYRGSTLGVCKKCHTSKRVHPVLEEFMKELQAKTRNDNEKE